MTRQALRDRLSGRQISIEQVWEWREFQAALQREERDRVLQSIRIGENLSHARYFGKTPEEIELLFAFQKSETDQLTMLALLSATEAFLRVDFQLRIADRNKDDVSRRFRELHKRSGLEQSLEDDILEAWKEYGSDPKTRQAVGQYKGALKLRHWLAHGRYWKPKLGANHDVIEIYSICDNVIRILH